MVVWTEVGRWNRTVPGPWSIAVGAVGWRRRQSRSVAVAVMLVEVVVAGPVNRCGFRFVVVVAGAVVWSVVRSVVVAGAEIVSRFIMVSVTVAVAVVVTRFSGPLVVVVSGSLVLVVVGSLMIFV